VKEFGCFFAFFQRIQLKNDSKHSVNDFFSIIIGYIRSTMFSAQRRKPMQVAMVHGYFLTGWQPGWKSGAEPGCVTELFLNIKFGAKTSDPNKGPSNLHRSFLLGNGCKTVSGINESINGMVALVKL